jgi:hypothetical protein
MQSIIADGGIVLDHDRDLVRVYARDLFAFKARRGTRTHGLRREMRLYLSMMRERGEHWLTIVHMTRRGPKQ